jgi:hypothetical protein
MPAGTDYETLVEQAMDELRRKNEALVQHQGLGGGGSWFVDQPSGKIAFTHPDGTKLTAPVQVIGTYSLQKETWLWAWDNSSILAPLRLHAEAVRRYGAEYGIVELTTPLFECDEEDCWTWTALACHLNRAEGAYRGPGKNGHTFMTFGTLEKLPMNG